MTDPLYMILEPRRTDTDEGLRARVADPVWFITRQWQLGELQGEDASTPVVVTSAPQHVPVTYDRTRPDLDPTVVPAEALLEAEPGLVDHRPPRTTRTRCRTPTRCERSRSVPPGQVAESL